MRRKCLSVLHLLIGEWSSILVLSQINTTWNILLPVGEGTAMLRDLVLPRVLENFHKYVLNGFSPVF